MTDWTRQFSTTSPRLLSCIQLVSHTLSKSSIVNSPMLLILLLTCAPLCLCLIPYLSMYSCWSSGNCCNSRSPRLRHTNRHNWHDILHRSSSSYYIHRMGYRHDSLWYRETTLPKRIYPLTVWERQLAHSRCFGGPTSRLLCIGLWCLWTLQEEARRCRLLNQLLKSTKSRLFLTSFRSSVFHSTFGIPSTINPQHPHGSSR